MQSWAQRCAAAGASVAATAAANSNALSLRIAFARLVDGAGGVPHRGGRPLRIRDHLRALVLDGLELPDRPAELLADLGVGRCGVGRPPRHPDRLGGQQRRHKRAGKCAAQIAQHPVVTDLDGVRADVRERSQRVDTADRLDLQCGGVEHHPLLAAVDRHRQHQHRGLRGSGHGPHLAADDKTVTVAGGGQPGVDRVRGDNLARREVVQQLGLRVVRGDQRAGDRGRHERAWHCAVAELGEHDRQFEDAEALSTNGFGEMNTSQALLGGGLPVRRRVRDRRLEGLVQNVRRCHPRHQGANRIGQVVVLRIYCDGHAELPSLITGGLGTTLPVRVDNDSKGRSRPIASAWRSISRWCRPSRCGHPAW